jgi:hypothetical protein
VTECIHGLDEALCDICSPRKAPEVQEAPTTSRARPAAAKKTTPRAPARVPGARRVVAEQPLPDVDLATMRAHHWTHVSNLELILADGRLSADAVPELDASSPEAREKRATAALPTGATVAGHVPFSLSPEASSWNEIRRGAEGPRWSAAARTSRPTDYIVFVAPVTSLPGQFVVTDGDATSTLTRFATGLSDGNMLVRRASFDDPDLLEVEVLVPEAVDLDVVSLIGVPNDRVRDRVKALIKAVGGASPRVAIYPPWFRPLDD